MRNELSVDLKIDESINKDNSINFDNLEEMKEFIKKIKEQLKVIALQDSKDKKSSSKRRRYYSEPCDNLEDLFSVRALFTFFSFLNYTISIEDGRIRNLNGFFSGFTLGVSYTSNGYFQAKTGISDNNIVVTTTGTLNYNLYWEGIGTIFRERVKYSILIPCNNKIVI